MSLPHLVTKRAATVVPFSTAISSLIGPLLYFHTHHFLRQGIRHEY